MPSRFAFLLVGAGLLLTLTGCSALVAAKGADGFDPEALRIGAPRADVEAALGPPLTSVSDPDGNRINTYQFRQRGEPSWTRAFGNMAMDLVTLGAWEIIGTPNELFLDPSRRVRQVTLSLDPAGRLLAITPPPPGSYGLEGRPPSGGGAQSAAGVTSARPPDGSDPSGLPEAPGRSRCGSPAAVHVDAEGVTAGETCG